MSTLWGTKTAGHGGIVLNEEGPHGSAMLVIGEPDWITVPNLPGIAAAQQGRRRVLEIVRAPCACKDQCGDAAVKHYRLDGDVHVCECPGAGRGGRFIFYIR